MKLPVPSIAKQKEIVAEYNVIQDRIKLNQQLIQKLVETAQAIYKHWFVDFEFPISAEQAAAMGKPELEGKPYKSSSGEMVGSESGKVPKGWEIKSVGNVVHCNASILTANDKYDTIEYLDTSNITNNEIGVLQLLSTTNDEIPSRAKRKVNNNDIIFSTVRPNLKHFGILINPNPNMIVSTGFAVLTPACSDLSSEFIYLLITNDANLQTLQAKAEMSVSTYPSINAEDILDLSIVVPDPAVRLKLTAIFKSQFELCNTLRQENKSLQSLRSLLLSKLATIEG